MEKTIDWNLLRIQYEIFGESLDDLCKEYGVSYHAIKYAAEEEKWRHLPIAKAINDWKEYSTLDEIPDDLVGTVQDRLSLLFTLKQSALNPRYIAIEAAILGKAQTLVESVDPENPNAAGILKTLGELFVGLKNASTSAIKAEEGQKDNKLVVNIGGPPLAEPGVEHTTPLVQIEEA